VFLYGIVFIDVAFKLTLTSACAPASKYILKIKSKLYMKKLDKTKMKNKLLKYFSLGELLQE